MRAYLVYSNRFAKHTNHIHNFYAIVGISLRTKFAKRVALENTRQGRGDEKTRDSKKKRREKQKRGRAHSLSKAVENNKNMRAQTRIG